MNLGGAAETWAYRAAWKLVQWLPARVAYGGFDRVADVMVRRNGLSVQRLRSNYARVRPELADAELDDLVARGVRSYLRYWCDAFRLPRQTSADLVAGIRLTGHADEARRVLAAGEPLILFLGHLGNWDHCGAWATEHFAPVTTVAERLEPEAVFEEFVAFRESLGMRILPLTGGDDTYGQLRTAIERGGFVPLLADRDLTSHGVEVSLLGHRIRAATGPARLALETGAALFPLAVTYEQVPGGRWRVVPRFGRQVQAPEGVDHAEQVRVMTQGCIDDLGSTIREQTQDWHMMQRIFLDDLDPARLPSAQQAPTEAG